MNPADASIAAPLNRRQNSVAASLRRQTRQLNLKVQDRKSTTTRCAAIFDRAIYGFQIAATTRCRNRRRFRRSGYLKPAAIRADVGPLDQEHRHDSTHGWELPGANMNGPCKGSSWMAGGRAACSLKREVVPGDHGTDNSLTESETIAQVTCAAMMLFRKRSV